MRTKFAFLTMFSLLLLSITGVFSARALAPDSMWVAPSNLTFDTHVSPVGTKFNVTIWLNVSTNTNSWQFYLIYKKAYLNATSCVYSGVGKSLWSGALPITPVSPGFGSQNATYNYVTFGEVLSSNAEKTGAGSLAIVTLKIMSAPPEGEAFTTDLRLDNAGIFSSQALDKDYNMITLTFGNAVYSYSAPYTPPPPAKIYVDPPSVIDRALTPCHNFTILVRITEATNVSSFDFRLNFNSTVIKASEVKKGDFFPDTTGTTIEINNVTGYVRVYASLAPSDPAVSGSGVLATVKFHVESLGYTLLGLTDIQIKDKKSHILPFTSGGGYFSNSVIKGDLNGDGKVDITDVAMAVGAFGSYPGHARWNPAADIDQNGRVDVMDIAVICHNFGQH